VAEEEVGVFRVRVSLQPALSQGFVHRRDGLTAAEVGDAVADCAEHVVRILAEYAPAPWYQGRVLMEDRWEVPVRGGGAWGPVLDEDFEVKGDLADAVTALEALADRAEAAAEARKRARAERAERMREWERRQAERD
jgi:hypothetical protein